MTAQLSAIVAPEHAPDLSGVLATMQPLSAVIGVAVFGSEYLALSAAGGAASAMHAFAILNATFVVAALAAAVLSLNGPRAALRASPHGSFTSTIPGTTRP
jgi:hypothetical protein